MRHIDRRAVSRFGVPEIVLMENAGLRLLEVLQRIEGDLKTRRILLLCGRGNNGGDTFVLARQIERPGGGRAARLLGRRPDVRGSAPTNLRAPDRRAVPARAATGPRERRAEPTVLEA